MKRLNSSDIRLMFIGFIVTFLLSAAMGQTVNNDVESDIIMAAGPRLGPIIVVEVTIPNRDALDELARAGYDISNVRGNVVTIYTSLEELERLKQTGYEYREIEQQPQPQGFELMALGGYHNYDTLTDELNIYAEAYPDICRLYTLGQSVQGRELWAVLITKNPDDEEDEPEFKYVSTIHGDEPVCTEMCLYFIDLLLTEYGTDERITNLIDGTAIWIVPLMNPDGLERKKRGNYNGTDLNRNFPLLTENSLNIFTGEPLDTLNRQPEVRHIMNWTAENSFVLSATFHSGAFVVIYPPCEQMRRVDTPTPDDLLYEEIARRYTRHNLPMWNSSQYPDGIINAAEWFPVRGTISEWSYRYVSCIELGIELSNAKRPSASQIPTLWSDNSESMLNFLEAVHIGVRGLITDRASGAPLWAQVLVKGNSLPVFTDPNMGDYHRMLLPGIYELAYHAYGYMPRLVKNVSVIDGHAVRVDVELIPEQASPDFNGDGIVDLQDLLILIECWGQDELRVDIAPLPDGDGIVNEQDLALLMEYWQKEIPGIELIGHWIAHWKLDETEGTIAYDSAGNNDGTCYGNPLWQPTAGKVDGALAFDGIDDYVSTDVVLNPSDGPFSVFAWIKGGAPGQVVISQTDGANWLLADPAEGKLMTELKSGSRSARPLNSQAIISDAEWHRVGFVWDGSHRTLYVDGIDVAKDTDPQDHFVPVHGGLHLGAGAALDAVSFFSGLIDDVRIYDRAVIP
jgi:carboxypeptidase D